MAATHRSVRARREASEIARILHTDRRQLSADLASVRLELEAPHRNYVESISTQQIAVSLETAAFLLWLYRRLLPTSILDCGTGFSTLVATRYASAHPGVRVLGIDDDAHWLEASQLHLDSTLRADVQLRLVDSLHDVHDRFDAVFYDFGHMDQRARNLPLVAAVVATGGFALLDDANRPELKAPFERMAIESRVQILNASTYTLDRFGRYASVAFC